jgi:hypothetical protein
LASLSFDPLVLATSSASRCAAAIPPASSAAIAARAMTKLPGASFTDAGSGSNPGEFAAAGAAIVAASNRQLENLKHLLPEIAHQA